MVPIESRQMLHTAFGTITKRPRSTALTADSLCLSQKSVVHGSVGPKVFSSGRDILGLPDVVLVPADALPENDAGVVADGAGIQIRAELCRAKSALSNFHVLLSLSSPSLPLRLFPCQESRTL